MRLRGDWYAAGAVALVLSVFSGGYGYHRDELYFRMLPADIGYVDQPPLTPFLARATRDLVADEQWALRIPATLCVAASVLVIAAITRELGGSRRAQALAAWGYGFAAANLMMGHLLITSTVDLLVWPALVWLVLRAMRSPRWWLAAGVLGGLSTYNRWLVVVLAAGLALGLALVGPRRVWRRPEIWGGVGLALLVAAPNLVFQASHDWPQLAMGEALADSNAAEVRTQVWPMLALLLGVPLLPIWVAGFVSLVRRPDWSDHRWLAVAFVVLVGFTWVSGAQVHYLMGLLPVMYAAGCVPVADWTVWHRGRTALVAAGVALNGAVALVLALPVVPVETVGDTPIPDISPLLGDTVGWPEYVDQVARVHEQAGGGDVPIITSNYGEAGAIDRFGDGLPTPYSGQNELWYVARPPDDADTVVMVGAQVESVAIHFATCDIVARLDNGDGVDNEEQGEPIAICTGPLTPWRDLWLEFRHLD
ncbi:glycosyltransferase family 39 protein [Nocardioides jensenii]|uniref:glycosyltransferase family 39 protein n=1 Tax=Nocardioides jensenii TaxID=1843 RepID=UPI00082BBBC5|nr:glycosyltransferase family 39 protein [Nocardioides jensenii]